MSASRYPYIPASALTVNGNITFNDIDLPGMIGKVKGFYLHSMIVYSFGDKYGNYRGKKIPQGYVIDHNDMNHTNNSINNLEVITNIRNLWRATFLLPGNEDCRKRFKEAYSKLTVDEVDQFNNEKEYDLTYFVIHGIAPREVK